MKALPKNLSVLAYAQGFTLWHYKVSSTEEFQAVDDNNFFSDTAGSFISLGDVILITGGPNAKIRHIGPDTQAKPLS